MQKKREIRIINGVKKLKCSKCKYWLSFDEYGNNKNTSTGKSSYCKVCRKSHYDSKRIKIPYNSGMKGLYLFKCEQCGVSFATKKSNKFYCSDKCRKKAWYIANEQTETGKENGKKLSHLNFKKKRT